MSKPVRIQLSRRKGWRMPESTVKVDRTTRYGNPYGWQEWMDDAKAHPFDLPHDVDRKQWCREQAVEAFVADIRDGTINLDLKPLRGKNLACWCPPGGAYSCHANVLLHLANLECEVVQP